MINRLHYNKYLSITTRLCIIPNMVRNKVQFYVLSILASFFKLVLISLLSLSTRAAYMIAAFGNPRASSERATSVKEKMANVFIRSLGLHGTIKVCQSIETGLDLVS